MTPGRWRWSRRRGRPTAPASPAGPATPGGGAGGGPAPGHSGGGGDGAALVAGDMFTPGRAGGRDVLVWEGSVAAPASPLGWHSRFPVEVFFHTGHHLSTRVLVPEFSRQLDRQLSALSLLSAERLLEGIRAYRAQGRHPTSRATRDARDSFMEQVVDDLRHVYQLSREDARARAAEVDRTLVVLHEPDQLLAGPGGPATTGPQPGYPSLGHGAVNSSLGPQNKPMVTVLEQAALAVPADQRPRVRLLLRAVLTGSPALAHQLRHGQVVLEPRTREQVSATSPRGPPWTPTHVASTLATSRAPWHPPAQAQEPGQDQPRAGQPHQPCPLAPTTTQPGPTTGEPPTRTGATAAGPPQTGQPPRTDRPGQPGHKTTPEEVLADIKAQAAQTAQQPAQARTPRQTPTRRHRRHRGLGR